MAITDNFNNTTPAAPAGNTNVTWQYDASTPTNVSAYYKTAGTIASVTNLLKGDGSGNAIDSGIAASSVGTVTSVAMTVPGFLSISGSPITTSGTLAIALATQAANVVFAGPASGSAAAPTFRALVAADLPLATTGAFGAVKPDGTSITIAAGVISASATVPSFADNETPSGALNGSNQTFTLAFTPNPAGSLLLVLNGVVQLQGTDYTLSTNTITLTNATPNSSNGEWLKAWYRH